jgi:hypothetical protein
LAACHFDLNSLRCAGAETNSCLTDAQIASARTIREDTTTSDGKLVYSHYGVGAETFEPNNWGHYSIEWPLNPAPENWLLANAMLKYAIFDNPNYDWQSFNIDRDYPTVVQALTTIHWQVDPAGLQTYASAGKKLLIWQGASDYAVSVNETSRFYADVVASVGGQAQADSFLRFYILPSVQHCSGGGPGASAFDQIGTITNWVEQGTAPQVLLASKLTSTGATILTRPLCPYPQWPRYNGAGDSSKAASFTCVTQ